MGGVGGMVMVRRHRPAPVLPYTLCYRPSLHETTRVSAEGCLQASPNLITCVSFGVCVVLPVSTKTMPYPLGTAPRSSGALSSNIISNAQTLPFVQRCTGTVTKNEGHIYTCGARSKRTRPTVTGMQTFFFGDKQINSISRQIQSTRSHLYMLDIF